MPLIVCNLFSSELSPTLVLLLFIIIKLKIKNSVTKTSGVVCMFFFVFFVGKPHEGFPIEEKPGNLTILLS